MKLNRVDFNKIAVFCQIIESGNLHRASEILHVTPSALSQTVSRLEHSLGFSLFERRAKKLIPTKEALKIHREFRRSQSDFIQTLKNVKSQQLEVSGTLRIGAYLEFAKSKLTPLINEFIQDFPAANIKMVFDSPSRLHSLLDQRHIDLCLSIFPSIEKKTIKSKALCQEELVLISSAGLLSDDPSFDQVLRTPIIDYFYNHQPIARWLALHYNKRPKKVPVRIFAATAEMVYSLVREGAGAGIVPRYLVAAQDLQSTHGIKIIRPTSKKLTDFIWLLEAMSSDRPAVHFEFKNRLVEFFESQKTEQI